MLFVKFLCVNACRWNYTVLQATSTICPSARCPVYSAFANLRSSLPAMSTYLPRSIWLWMHFTCYRPLDQSVRSSLCDISVVHFFSSQFVCRFLHFDCHPLYLASPPSLRTFACLSNYRLLAHLIVADPDSLCVVLTFSQFADWHIFLFTQWL